jgi:hypothetical protein
VALVIDAHYHFIYLMDKKLSEIEIQLKKRWAYPYKWLRKQNDQWDAYTNFIYTTPNWEDLIKAISTTVEQHKLNKEEAFYYAINRWYNFWSSVAVEVLFCSIPQVIPAKNNKDKLIDFSIHNIPFDHKTSVFPKGFKNNFAYAEANKEQLLYWLYNNQSQQGRKHHANRLFIIVHNQNGKHWKLKAEISLIQKAISNYVATFEAKQLITLKFSENQTALSDIIWVKL